ncbi:MAG: rRNA maturation RNase YbeY [bacterium]
MPVTIQCREFSLTGEEAEKLWLKVVVLCGCPDEIVTVRCVGEREIKRLNKRYRGKDKVTNVLTFSYQNEPRKASPRGEHDVAICLSVVAEKDVAWLLVHAFLHVAGMDHEKSAEEAKKMEQAEAAVLKDRGF